MGMRAPESLTSEHNIAEFCCQEPALNEWLKKKALRNNSTGISRVYVVCAENTNRVIGYYCLSSGSVHRNTVPGAYRRNAPDVIPVIVLGRLAIDQAWSGNGLGAAILKDAIYRTQNIAFQVGVRALAVHALNEEVKCFYTRFGFEPSIVNTLTLLFPIKV
ncbi:TPA: GNAT family N-acetyltransferase [Klebsiella quasipneumoniae subsp. similipneumoniae]|uniref:GNAT family N-acetyltransferase n=1 Tax=Klebsiella TaxID=570 RepID=UPI000B4156AF|nr:MULTISPECIES: GNAT family N-acetyltransferase [Klebsiella]HDH1412277.1 GNAT family N-acetyltransferase [Klebsiella quasipneumoniae subsp. similipneumoniae]MBR8606048.1 GNAT family N-acetyltransferase [Klebsiella pneumoniae subsp. pneumoniae]MCA5498801.1 GNAT family N-acetyltransferase [Klebsiella pneumoniae]MCA5509652.1 GNAT family N-acetyltransferase [Klebsiella pneumoniae]MDE3915942.1 GNAT family N-acetyltransferase [Klebsiella pneumoniae]